MTYSFQRVDLHNNGDCDAATCPLCELEPLTCEWCGDETDEDGRNNACGIGHCLECIGRCRACQDDINDQGDL